MEVILLERIERLGQMGDVVKVKDGYARNYLLPKKKALRANAESRVRFEERRVQLEADNIERRSEAESVAAKMEGLSVVMVRQAGDSGQLYGSVNARDIAAAITEAGVRVERGQIAMTRVIKSLGLYPVRVVLHPEVSVEVSVNVARTEEEARLQAAGVDVTAADRDTAAEEAALAAEEVFEPEALPEEIEQLEFDETGAQPEVSEQPETGAEPPESKE